RKSRRPQSRRGLRVLRGLGGLCGFKRRNNVKASRVPRCWWLGLNEHEIQAVRIRHDRGAESTLECRGFATARDDCRTRRLEPGHGRIEVAYPNLKSCGSGILQSRSDGRPIDAFHLDELHPERRSRHLRVRYPDLCALQPHQVQKRTRTELAHLRLELQEV